MRSSRTKSLRDAIIKKDLTCAVYDVVNETFPNNCKVFDMTIQFLNSTLHSQSDLLHFSDEGLTTKTILMANGFSGKLDNEAVMIQLFEKMTGHKECSDLMAKDLLQYTLFLSSLVENRMSSYLTKWFDRRTEYEVWSPQYLPL